MRGFSPKLVLGKQVNPLFKDRIDDVRKSPDFYVAVACEAISVLQQYSNSEDPYYSKYMGDVANVLIPHSPSSSLFPPTPYAANRL